MDCESSDWCVFKGERLPVAKSDNKVVVAAITKIMIIFILFIIMLSFR